MPRRKKTAAANYASDDYMVSYEGMDGSIHKGWVSYNFSSGGQGPANWWQFAPPSIRRESTTAYACKMILCQEVAKLRVYHKKELPSGEVISVENSPFSRLLRKPNHYQNRSDFFLAVMDSLCFTGNAYCFAPRDVNGNIKGLYPIVAGGASAYVVPDSGAVFYNISSDPLAMTYETMWPARNVLHIRLLCPRHPLVGETPLVAAALSGALGDAIQSSNLALMVNQSKPGGVIETDKPLPPNVVDLIKQGWKDATSGPNSGATPILTHGLSWKATQMSAVDAEVIALYALQKQDVASVYRVPLYMLGDMTKMTFNNVETIQRHFYASCLGFYLEHIETALDDFFGLPEDEFMEFDVESGLMRAEFKERIAALTSGIQGGCFAPNEARLKEGLKKVEGGDTVFLQKQMVPITVAANPPPEPVPALQQPPEASPVAASVPASVEKEFNEEFFRLLVEKNVREGLAL